MISLVLAALLEVHRCGRPDFTDEGTEAQGRLVILPGQPSQPGVSDCTARRRTTTALRTAAQ